MPFPWQKPQAADEKDSLLRFIHKRVECILRQRHLAALHRLFADTQERPALLDKVFRNCLLHRQIANHRHDRLSLDGVVGVAHDDLARAGTAFAARGNLDVLDGHALLGVVRIPRQSDLGRAGGVWRGLGGDPSLVGARDQVRREEARGGRERGGVDEGG